MTVIKGRPISSPRDVGAIAILGLKKLTRSVLDFGSLYFFECDLQKPLPPVRPNPAVVIREAFLADLDLLDKMDDAHRHKQVAIERLDRGDRWFVVLDSATGELANFRWLSHSGAWIPEIERYLHLKPGEVYFYDLFTRPKYRRMGIDALARHTLYSLLADSGMTRVYAYVHGCNYPMLQASRRVLSKIARVWYIRLRRRDPLILCASEAHAPRFLESLQRSPGFDLGWTVRAGEAPEPESQAVSVKKAAGTRVS